MKLLLEHDRRGKIKARLKLNDSAASIFHDISNKHSFEISQAFMRSVLNEYKSASNNGRKDILSGLDLISFLNLMFKHNFVNPHLHIDTSRNFSRTFYDDCFELYLGALSLRDFFEWYDNQNEVRYELKNKTLEELVALSDQWHNKKSVTIVTDKVERKDEVHGDRFMEFPNGFYWVNLKVSKSHEEEKFTGHCASVAGNHVLLSLRDKLGNTHVTAEYNPSSKSIHQIKGRKNSRPVKYSKYIVQLLFNKKYEIKRKVRSAYKPNLDWHVIDLQDQNTIYKVAKKNPDLLTGGDLEIDDINFVVKLCKLRGDLLNHVTPQRRMEINLKIRYSLLSKAEKQRLKSEDIYVFVARPKFVPTSNDNYKKSIEIENMVKVDLYTVEGQTIVNALKRRAGVQGEQSRLYYINVQRGLFNGYGKNGVINDETLPDYIVDLIMKRMKPL